MTDYEQLVKALRWCDAGFMHECDNCLYLTYKHNKDDCMDRMLRDAAAAIEDLAKHITEMHERVTVLQIDRGHLETEVKRLKMRCADCEYASKPWPELEPKQGEWELIDEAEPMRWGCSRCKYLSWETSSYCPRCGAKMEAQE